MAWAVLIVHAVLHAKTNWQCMWLMLQRRVRDKSSMGKIPWSVHEVPLNWGLKESPVQKESNGLKQRKYTNNAQKEIPHEERWGMQSWNRARYTCKALGAARKQVEKEARPGPKGPVHLAKALSFCPLFVLVSLQSYSPRFLGNTWDVKQRQGCTFSQPPPAIRPSFHQIVPLFLHIMYF